MNFKDLIYLNILFLLINLKFKDVLFMNSLIWVYEIYLKNQRQLFMLINMNLENHPTWRLLNAFIVYLY